MWREAQPCSLQAAVRLNFDVADQLPLTCQVSMPCDRQNPTCRTQLLLGLLL